MNKICHAHIKKVTNLSASELVFKDVHNSAGVM